MSGFLNVWAKKVHIVTTQLLERVENFSSRVRVVKRKSSSRVPSGTLQGLPRGCPAGLARSDLRTTFEDFASMDLVKTRPWRVPEGTRLLDFQITTRTLLETFTTRSSSRLVTICQFFLPKHWIIQTCHIKITNIMYIFLCEIIPFSDVNTPLPHPGNGS